jgi:hypothetical protein
MSRYLRAAIRFIVICLLAAISEQEILEQDTIARPVTLALYWAREPQAQADRLGAEVRQRQHEAIRVFWPYFG